MKKIISITVMLMLIIPAFVFCRVTYLSENDYKKLKKRERQNYWESLENELASLQKRKADAIAESDKYSKRIEELKAEKVNLEKEYKDVYNKILSYSGVDKSEFSSIKDKIKYHNEESSCTNGKIQNCNR